MRDKVGMVQKWRVGLCFWNTIGDDDMKEAGPNYVEFPLCNYVELRLSSVHNGR